MKLIDALFAEKNIITRDLVDDVNPNPYLTAFLNTLGGYSYDFIQTNYPALFKMYRGVTRSCIDFISRNESFAKPILYEYENQTDRHELDEHPFIQFLDNLNPEFTNEEMSWVQSQNLRIIGTVYLKIIRGKGGYPKQAWMLPLKNSFSMQHEIVNGIIVKYKYIDPVGKESEINPKDIIHFRLPNPLDPYTGLGILAGNPYVFSMEEDLSIYHRNYINNAAEGKTYLTLDPDFSDDEIELAVKKYLKINQGLANVGKPRFLSHMILNKSSDNPVEMDLTKSHELYENKIMMSFPLNPVLMGKLLNANRATAQVAADHFHNYHLKPVLQLYAGKWTQFLRNNYVQSAKMKIEYSIPPLFDREMGLKELEQDCKIGALRYNQYLKVRGYDPIYELDSEGNKTGKLDPKGFEFIKPYNERETAKGTLAEEQQQVDV